MGQGMSQTMSQASLMATAPMAITNVFKPEGAWKIH